MWGGGEQIRLHLFVNLTLDVGELSNSPTGCFNPRRNTLFYPLNRGMGGLHSWNVSVEKERNF